MTEKVNSPWFGEAGEPAWRMPAKRVRPDEAVELLTRLRRPEGGIYARRAAELAWEIRKSALLGPKKGDEKAAFDRALQEEQAIIAAHAGQEGDGADSVPAIAQVDREQGERHEQERNRTQTEHE